MDRVLNLGQFLIGVSIEDVQAAFADKSISFYVARRTVQSVFSPDGSERINCSNTEEFFSAIGTKTEDEKLSITVENGMIIAFMSSNPESLIYDAHPVAQIRELSKQATAWYRSVR